MAALFWLVMLCTGCASTDYQWTKARPASVKPWFYVTVADTDRTCRDVGADPQRRLGRINACATWLPVGCIIYLPEGPHLWIIRHEERHCEGHDHE